MSRVMYCKSPRSRREKQRSRKNFEEIMAKSFSNMMKDTNLHNQEAQQTPSRINSRSYTLRHLMVKLSKDKGRILKASREKRLSKTMYPQ